MTETVLSVKGQIVIPQYVRETLGLKPGQKFEVEAMSDGTILIIPIPNEVTDMMQLPAAERLEKALVKERKKDEKKHKEIARNLKTK